MAVIRTGSQKALHIFWICILSQASFTWLRDISVTIKGAEGQSVILPCRSHGEAALWTKSNWTILGVFARVQIPESPWKDVVSVAGRTNLRITSLDPHRDQGEFVCTSELGRQTVTVQVKRKSKFPNGPADVDPSALRPRVRNVKPKQQSRDFPYQKPRRKRPRPTVNSTPKPSMSPSRPVSQPPDSDPGSSEPSPPDDKSSPIPPTLTESGITILGVSLGVLGLILLIVLGLTCWCYNHRLRRKQQVQSPAANRPPPVYESRLDHGEGNAPTYTHLSTTRTSDGYLTPVTNTDRSQTRESCPVYEQIFD